MFDKIPQDLKENALFCLYKMEQRKGKATKVPYQVNGRRADTSNPKCFSDFKTVCDEYSKGGYIGIGMGVFPPYKVFDLDGCVVDGKITIFAQEIIETLNSYTEYSPSGKGVHIITKVDKFKPDVNKYYINNRKYGLEMYDGRVTHRYITVTGDVIRDMPPMYRDAEVQKVADKYMKRSAKKQKQQSLHQEVFCRMTLLYRRCRSQNKQRSLKFCGMVRYRRINPTVKQICH